MNNFTSEYYIHLVDLYHKINGRLQRHIKLGRFHTLSASKQQFLLQKVQKLELRLASLGYTIPMAGATLAMAATLASTPQAMAQGFGKEFKVNRFTANSQQNTQVAKDNAGNYVVVWQSNNQASGSSSYDIYAQRYTAAGTTVGGEFLVNTYTSNYQQNPTVAMDADGDFVVAWQSRGQIGSKFNIYAQRYHSSGTLVGVEFRVNTYTSNNEIQNPAIAMDADGDFVIAWQSQYQDGSGNGIYAQRYHSSGTLVGVEFKVNTYTSNYQQNPAIAMDADGDFVVAWQSNGQDGSDNGIYAQRYHSSGTLVGVEFRANRVTTYSQQNPAIAMDADGDFVVAWQSNGQDGSGSGIYAQRYSATTGTTVGVEFKVNTYTSNYQQNPAIAMDADGDFVVAWQSNGQDGSSNGIYAQRYTAAGTTVGSEFLVNTYTTSSQENPAIAMISETGDFVVAWQSNGQDGSSNGIYVTKSPNEPTLGSNKFNQIEKIAGTTVLGTLNVFVPGFTNVPVTYSILSGNEDNKFSLNTTTGVLSAIGALDYDIKPSHVLTVQVAMANNAAIKSSNTVTINVIDVLNSPQVSPVGGEFLVNTIVTGSQTNAQVATDAAGNFVVVYELPYGGNTDIYAQRYTAGGTPLGVEFRVNTQTSSNQSIPAIAMDADGDFVVAWQSYGQDGSSNGIYAQRYHSSGTLVGVEFRVNTQTSSNQSIPAIAMDADGDFVVAWTNQDGNGDGIYAQRYSATTGTTVGVEFKVNTETYSTQTNPAIAIASATGDFVVAWQSYGQDGNGNGDGIYAQRYSATTGTTVGVEFRVNTETSRDQSIPAIAMDADGDFVVAWQSNGQDGSGNGIYAQRFNTTTTVGAEFKVNTFTENNQTNPTISMDANGDFVVAWQSNSNPGENSSGVYAKRYNAAGQVEVNEFRVNTYTINDQQNPTIAMDADGDFVVAWESYYQNGIYDNDIYAQRYRNTAPTVTGFSSTITEGVTNVALPIGTVSGADMDVFQTLSYSITGGNVGNVFAINAATGVVSVAGTIDYSRASYLLNVQVADNGKPMRMATTTVSINLVASTNVAPTITGTTFTISGAAALGSNVGTVLASDANAGQILTYSITGGNVGNVFTINTTTGVITVAGTLNYATTPSYALVVKVTDNGLPIKNASATINIVLTAPVVVPINNAPTITGGTFTIEEGKTKLADVLGTLQASDPDAGQLLTYTITDGNTGNVFSINTTTGAIALASLPDFTKTSYALTVKVSDNGTPSKSNTALITINVVRATSLVYAKPSNGSNITLYPNPAKDQITIPILGRKQVSISNLLGKVVSNITTDFETIDVASLPAGVYMVQIKVGDALFYGKFIKE